MSAAGENQNSVVEDGGEEEKEADTGEVAAGGSKRKRKRKRKKPDKPKEENDHDDEQDQQQHANYVERTVFVEGIPFDATPDQVKDFFESHDGIGSDVVELRLPTWQDSGRLRGYGHVLFGTQGSYEKALGLTGKYLGKRFLTIQPANAPKGNGGIQSTTINSNDPPPKDCRTLFVTNLPYGATEEEISQAFEKYGGDIAEDGVRIARNSVTRQSKGFAYVDFVSPQDAHRVVKGAAKKSVVVAGRIIRLDYDTGRMKGSFRTNTGRLWTKENQEKKQQRVD